MSKTLSLTLAICTCFLFTQCANNPILPHSKDLSQLTLAERSIIASDNQFGFKLFKEISQEKNENIFISPLSVAMALGMTYNGAN